MANKYIDLDSTYRNRKDYPNPCDFVSVYTSSGRKGTSEGAVDPILDAYPYFSGFASIGSTALDVKIGGAGASLLDNSYVGSYLNVLPGEYRKIISYSSATAIATLESSLSINPTGLDIFIRKSLPVLEGVVSGGSTTYADLPVSASTTNDFYKGYFIYFSSGLAQGSVVRISSYDGTLQRAFFASPTPLVQNNDSFQILAFSRDNFNPFNYAGTTTVNQEVCYTINLLCLTLSNKTLSSGYGGTLSNYPYVYLRLYPENKSNPPIFYSNNPNANSALFKVPIDNKSDIYVIKDTFYILNGSGTTQMIKFRPHDNFRMTVTLPSGEILKYQDDTVSPEPPNPLIQVSALFEIKRV